MKQRVVIIGAGEIGLAIGKIVVSSGCEIEFWDRDPRKVQGQKRLDETVVGAGFVFVCVPSWGMREVLTTISSYIGKKTIVVSLVKGMDPKGSEFSDELMFDILAPGQPFAILGGAMIAEEIGQGEKVYGVLASRDDQVFVELSKLFAKSNCQLEFIKDMRGVALAGVMKNIYALGLGIADGLRLSPEVKEGLMIKAMNEMVLATSIFGGEVGTIEGRAGKEDLIKTGSSKYSRNHEVGVKIASAERTEIKSEGTESLPIIFSKVGSRIKDFPFLDLLYSIVVKNSDPLEIENLVSRVSKV